MVEKEEIQEEDHENNQEENRENNQETNQEEKIDYEKAAMEMGWNPKYDGPNKKSAKEFYERGLEIQPILQKNLKRSEARIDELNRRIEAQQREFQKALSISQKIAKRDFESKLEQIKREKAEAVSNADKDAFERLEKQEDTLRESFKETFEQPEVQYDPAKDPVLNDWLSENKWMENPEMSEYAGAYGQYINKTRPTLKGRAFLEAITEGVKEKFHDKFENPRRNNHSVSAPTNGKTPGKKDFGSLPKEAKEAFDYLKKFEPKMTKEAYAKEYWEMDHE